MIDYLTEVILTRAEDFSLPQPDLSARLGVLVALATAMEVVVEQRALPIEAYPFTDQQLVEELSRLLDAYFTKS